MSREHEYTVTIEWAQESGTSSYREYSRAHTVSAPGKETLAATADPAFLGATDRWNPEELLVAALSQCHMLTYLALCARSGVVVTEYTDEARGTMRESPDGGGAFSEVTLYPEVTVAEASMINKAEELHAKAHSLCFIANSVNFPVNTNPSTTT